MEAWSSINGHLKYNQDFEGVLKFPDTNDYSHAFEGVTQFKVTSMDMSSVKTDVKKADAMFKNSSLPASIITDILRVLGLEARCETAEEFLSGWSGDGTIELAQFMCCKNLQRAFSNIQFSKGRNIEFPPIMTNVENCRIDQMFKDSTFEQGIMFKTRIGLNTTPDFIEADIFENAKYDTYEATTSNLKIYINARPYNIFYIRKGEGFYAVDDCFHKETVRFDVDTQDSFKSFLSNEFRVPKHLKSALLEANFGTMCEDYKVFNDLVQMHHYGHDCEYNGSKFYLTHDRNIVNEHYELIAEVRVKGRVMEIETFCNAPKIPLIALCLFSTHGFEETVNLVENSKCYKPDADVNYTIEHPNDNITGIRSNGLLVAVAVKGYQISLYSSMFTAEEINYMLKHDTLPSKN